MCGLKSGKLFAFKGMMRAKPFSTLGIMFVILVLSFSFMLRIGEGPVYFFDSFVRNANIDYNDIYNCIWSVIVTTTTTGYGDYYPRTLLGRLIKVSIALIGTVFTTLIINSVQQSIKLHKYEENVFVSKERLMKKEEIKEASGHLFLTTFRQKIKLKKYLKALEHYEIYRLNYDSNLEKVKFQNKLTFLRNELRHAVFDSIDSRRNFRNLVRF